MKKIVKIVTFYDDGTFTESTPSPYMPTTPYVPPAPYVPPPPYTGPYNPQWPSYPPYTIYCKTEDGTMQEMNVGPAFATNVKSNG